VSRTRRSARQRRVVRRRAGTVAKVTPVAVPALRCGTALTLVPHRVRDTAPAHE